MTTLFVGLISLASFYLFYFHRGLIVGHDIVLEIVRLVEVKEALSSQFYPRLAPDLYAGYGSPVLVFYPPLFPLLTSLVDFAFNNFNLSVKLVIVSLGAIGSIFCYSFLGLFSRRDAALLGTVFYVLAPYKFTDVYARNAFAEYTALSLLPAVFYFLASNFVGRGKDSTRSQAGLFFSFLLLSVSHTISLLIAFPFVLLSAFYFHWRTKPDSNGQSSKAATLLVRTLAIMFLAVGSASFYLLPAFVYRNLVQMENFTAGKFYFGGNFVNFFEIFFNHSTFLYQSPIPLIVLLCGLLFLLLRVTPVLAESPLGRLGVGFSFACLFMMSSLSFFLWNVLPLIHYAQFPWRFLLFFTFFMCWIVAFVADQFLPRYESWVWVAVMAFILLLGGTHHAQYMQSKIFDATTITARKILYSNLPATAAAEDLPSVVPKTAKLRISERRKAIESSAGTEKSANPTHYRRCRSFPEKTRFEFALFNFPFWKLSVDGVPASRYPDAPMLQTEVPAGAHCVEARLGFLDLQVVGFFTSAFSLVLFCGFATWSRRSIRAGPFR